MAIKFEIVGDPNKEKLLVTDTVSGDVVIHKSVYETWYYVKWLEEKNLIQIIDSNAVSSRASRLWESIPLSNAVDENDVTFTKTSWRDWATANLGFKTAPGGSGAGWDGKVEFRGDLPTTINDPQIGSIYLVEKPTKILLGAYTTYQSGLYFRDFNNGNLNDWRRLNVKVKFTDTEFRIVKASDQSKQAQFDLNLISANRSLTIQDKDGTIALVGDIIQRFEAVLDSSDPNITRTVSGGRTIWEVTHNLNTNYVVQEVYRVSNGRTTRMRVERTGLNTLEVSRAGTVADGTYAIKIVK